MTACTIKATVNGTAYPVLEVKRRKYRLRFLDASIARIYEFKLMRGTPKAARALGYTGDELQGQYRLPDGQQCMKLVEIAGEGGLLPTPIVRDSFELWPAKRREVVVDFTTYIDGSATKPGDEIYLVDVMKMTTGRMWDLADPNYKVPVMKIVIGGDPPEPDVSQIPPKLRDVPWFPSVGDGVASNVGSDCTDRGRIALNVGTSAALRIMTPEAGAPVRGLWRYRLDRKCRV